MIAGKNEINNVAGNPDRKDKEMRTTNQSAYSAVMAKEKFTASNMFAEWMKIGLVNSDNGVLFKELYVVYSYGYHFPMWVWDESAGQWIGNKDKYSRSTTRQQSQTRPSNITTWLNTEEMKKVVQWGGLAEFVMKKAQV